MKTKAVGSVLRSTPDWTSCGKPTSVAWFTPFTSRPPTSASPGTWSPVRSETVMFPFRLSNGTKIWFLSRIVVRSIAKGNSSRNHWLAPLESGDMLGGGLVPPSVFASSGVRDRRAVPPLADPKTWIVGSSGLTDFFPPPPPPHPEAARRASAPTSGPDHRTRFKDISRPFEEGVAVAAPRGRPPLISPVLPVKALSASSPGLAAECIARTPIVPQAGRRRPTSSELPRRVAPERFRSRPRRRLPCRVRGPPIHSPRPMVTIADGRRVPWGGGRDWRGSNDEREPLCRFESAG